MAETAARGGRKPASLRTIWAIAKSPALAMSEEDVHALVYRETGKDSLRQLTPKEIAAVAQRLQRIKDGDRAPVRKRTDEGGNQRTEQQRRKIYALCGELGWNDDARRINGFIKRMCGVERLEWLTPAQCYTVIEALKKMVEREETTRYGSENEDRH